MTDERLERELEATIAPEDDGVGGRAMCQAAS
jgi:hypothetical protein